MLEKWNKMPHWARWLLFIPVTIILMLIGGITFGFIAMRIASPESFIGNILLLVNSFISTAILIWSAFNLPPSGKKIIGWLMFCLVLIYLGISTVMLLDDKDLFGNSLPDNVNFFWATQNVVWFISGLITALYCSRRRTAYSAKPEDPLGLHSNDPIGTTIKNLARQQAEAAARGESIVNRFPQSMRMQRLKFYIVQALQDMEATSIGIDDVIYRKLLAIDTKGGVGIAANDFDEISQYFPAALLENLEIDVRRRDSHKSRPDFDDIDSIYSS